MIFLSFRTRPQGGAVTVPPRAYWAEVAADGAYAFDPVSLEPGDPNIAGRRLVLAVHGFNVGQDSGVRGLFRLGQRLGRDLGAGWTVIGVLWPGDFWIPAINYPAEASDAVVCGRSLADVVNSRFARARSVSFVSHSLGGRLVLEAVKGLNRPAARVCLTAPAVDDDCLSGQYDAARAKAELIAVLASRKDRVLKLAYPAGDFVSDIAGDDDSPWRRALGYHGPRPFLPAKIDHDQIAPDGTRGSYRHSDYFPPSDPKDPEGRSGLAMDYMAASLAGRPTSWPP